MSSRTVKNIVITGANSGVGLETAKGLYRDGHNIIFGSRNQQRNQEAESEIKKTGGKGTVKSFSLDLSKRQSVDDFADFVKKNYDVIDILINNAGLVMPQSKPKQINPENGF